MYSTYNISHCQIVKPINFLSFDFLNFDWEFEQLKQIITEVRETNIIRAKELKEKGMRIKGK